MLALQPMMLSGAEVLPLVEGGKGVAVSNGRSAGAWAAAGGVGTFSGVNADILDDNGETVPLVYHGKTREERHEELIDYSIRGAVSQARVAHELRGGQGRVHMNVLWEMGGCERVLEGVLQQAKGLIHGVTCGAGMPYRLSEIAARHGVHYYPIISSGRAFNALWKRAYSRVSHLLGAVVYEDPWRAGGHNGLSNGEDPTKPQDPLPRVLELRALMRRFGLDHVPIVMAGGVWHLRDWADWVANKELGPIAFQFGTRPLLTRESPIPEDWKRRLMSLVKGDVFLNRFSPTGFYSSAVKNAFLQELEERSDRQVEYADAPDRDRGLVEGIPLNARRFVYIRAVDLAKARDWMAAGFTTPMKTPEGTLIFAAPDRAREIKRDQANCMGCLSHCKFSNWKDQDDFTTGRLPDPRSFCIQKTLQDVSHGGDIDHNLMFAGHSVFRFRADPFYSNGFVPTVRQLVERIATGY